LDGLALQTQQKTSTTAALLLQLEMKGVVRALPGKYYELI
jgi:predicted Rossmann fold nucleotide-binding protein DprA/Smf involved in DNA uptake